MRHPYGMSHETCHMEQPYGCLMAVIWMSIRHAIWTAMRHPYGMSHETCHMDSLMRHPVIWMSHETVPYGMSHETCHMDVSAIWRHPYNSHETSIWHVHETSI